MKNDKLIKILIVEDEMIVAFDLKQQLMTIPNHTVVDTVGKGDKAIEVAKLKKPDLILMDIVLGKKMNGLTAAREILNIYNPVIIFTSGFIDDKISDEITSMNAFMLRKPYNVSDINGIIEEVFV
ncbi:MAG TPA: response regulator [Ignavibacteriaceae bacterium]|nr:response regulator [Ignavibacteriaceae bacterium]